MRPGHAGAFFPGRVRKLKPAPGLCFTPPMRRISLDLNCDLGEGEAPRRTRALLRWVDSANIACGGHVGDEHSMRRCLRWCRELDVNAGAHPGFEDRENFGRVEHPITPRGLTDLLTRQVDAFSALAREEGVKVTHLKLHGALYHVVERDRKLARAFVDFVKSRHPRWRIIASATGLILPLAGPAGWGEIFADRGYTPQGGLVPRGERGAVLHQPGEIRARVGHFLRTGMLEANDGTMLRLDARTICVHADSPDSVQIARLLASVLNRRKA